MIAIADGISGFGKIVKWLNMPNNNSTNQRIDHLTRPK